MTRSVRGHRPRYTFADYLEVEELSPVVKHEFVDGEILAMAGGSIEHTTLQAALIAALGAQLRGTPLPSLFVRSPDQNPRHRRRDLRRCGSGVRSDRAR